MDKDTFMTVLREETIEATSAYQGITGSDDKWWGYENFGSLRSGCLQCPITFVANCFNDRWDPSEWEGAARELELEPALAREIVLAADGHMFEDGYSQELRDELIEATGAGLNEGWAQ